VTAERTTKAHNFQQFIVNFVNKYSEFVSLAIHCNYTRWHLLRHLLQNVWASHSLVFVDLFLDSNGSINSYFLNKRWVNTLYFPAFFRWDISVIFCWSVLATKHFGHLSHSCIKTCHNSVFQPIFSSILTEMTEFFSVISKTFWSMIKKLAKKNSIYLSWPWRW